MINMTGPIGAIVMMIGSSVGRLRGEHQFMIGLGADSVYTIGLVIVFNIFPGIKKSLKRWQMLGFPMNSYSAGMLIPIAATTSSMVSRGVDQDIEKKAAV